MSDKRRRGSFSARLRHEVTATGTTTATPDETLAERTTDPDGYPCPSQIKPLLYFYKYLQPLPDGRKLQLNMPATLVCEKRHGREDVVSMTTDSAGWVVRDDKGPTWRKRILFDFVGVNHMDAASLLTVGVDDVVAVRNVAHWKKSGGPTPTTTTASSSTSSSNNNSNSSSANSKSIVLTRRAFDHVINAPIELAFSVQQYIRCRGSHASIFRVTWSERDNRRFAINIFNEHKISDAPKSVWARQAANADELRPHGTPLEVAFQQMAILSPYYCVSSTSGNDAKTRQQRQQIPKVRGAPVAEGVDAVKRIVDHVTSQLPGIKVKELTADFIKDSSGKWWFIRAVHFDAWYRVEIPASILGDPELDSAVVIPEVLRSKHFRQSLRTIASMPPANTMIPNCSLCGCLCQLPKALRDEMHSHGDESSQPESPSSATTAQSADADMFKALSEYRMTLKMVVTALYQLRQRGQGLPIWEYAAQQLMKTPAGLGTEFTVCYLCYKIYKSQALLARAALDLNEAYGIHRPAEHVMDPQAMSSLEQAIDPPCDPMPALLTRIQQFNQEKCMSFVAAEDGNSPIRSELSHHVYTPVKGVDIDPTCLQIRLAFFFHELQDGGPDISPTDFYLEYHLGQHFTRLDFEGSKCHTPNRWQLCEARLHYVLSTMDGFSDYCSDKRLRIKMKTVAGDEYHGHTSLSLRPLLSAAKWYGNLMQRESRTDYLLELKTGTFGLLTLKVTLGLLVDAVPLCQVRELIKEQVYIKEDAFTVFWPPLNLHSCSLPVPVDWVGALTPSEYMSIVPMRSRRSVTGRRRVGYAMQQLQSNSAPKQRTTEAIKSPSQRFSAASLAHDGALPLPSSPPQSNPVAAGRKSSVPTLPLSPYLLATVVGTAKRIIYRAAGEVTSFPTVFIAHILRHASFLAQGPGANGGAASWTEPASLQLTSKYTVDTIFLGIQPAPTASLCVMGEVLLVLLKCQLLPAVLQVSSLEKVLTPFWLAGGNQDDPKAQPFDMISPRHSTVPSHQRMVWNRAIRRCQVEHFCSDFRAFDRNTSKLAQDDEQLQLQPHHHHDGRSAKSTYEEMAALRRKLSYRAKTQAYILCGVFEIMEASDSGYIEIAELRSLDNCTATPRCESTVAAADHRTSYDLLPHAELDALAGLLSNHQEIAEVAFVRCLMESELMQHSLTQFDRLGRGGMNFDEFWALGETVLEAWASSYGTQDGEPTCTAFCLRHGIAEAYALDCCCVQCSFQYQDQELLPPGCQTIGRHTEKLNASDGDDDGDDDSDDSDSSSGDPEVVHPIRQPTKSTGIDTAAEDAADRVDPFSSRDPNRFDEPALVDTLQKLEAAEWHVRYRRESLGTATLQAALTGRKASVATARRSSAASTVSDKSSQKPMLFSSYSITELVTEAEQRKEQAFRTRPPTTQKKSQQMNQKTGKEKDKQKKKKPRHFAASSAQKSTRLQSSHSLSTLLRMELENASRHHGPLLSCDATRSTKLIDTVHRGESKRKKLDRLVLAELDDVKQRLARLFQTC